MAVGRDEDVRGLDVAVHVARAVDRVQRVAQAGDQVGGGLRRERALAPARPQVGADHEAHREIGDAVGLARGVDGDHVRVLDRRRGARLLHEALADRGILEQLRCDQLEGDDAIERDFTGAVDHAHSPAADHRLDAVSRDHRPGREQGHTAVYIRLSDC